MRYPHHDDRATESELSGYSGGGGGRPCRGRRRPTWPRHYASSELSDDFEHLRWFDLPAACMTSAPEAVAAG
jgi:hypothetical protein